MYRVGVSVAAAVAFLAAPTASQAGSDTIGSDLSGSATTAIQRTEDTALAQLADPGGARPTVPNSGQVVSIKVKGCSAKNNVPQNPETLIFVQDLRTESDGSEHVISSSQPFNLPICGAHGADRDTVSTFAPTDQCVGRGDHVGVVVGGQTPGYPNGTEYFIAKPSAGARLGAFSKNSGAVNGSRFALTPIADTELLAQVHIGTGSDSPSGCPADPGGSGGGGGGGGGGGPGGGGGGGGATVSAASLKIPRRVAANPKTGRGVVEAACALPAGDACRVSLVATTGKRTRSTKPKRVGTISGSVAGGQTVALTLRLNRAGVVALRRKKQLSMALRGTIRGAAGRASVSHRLRLVVDKLAGRRTSR